MKLELMQLFVNNFEALKTNWEELKNRTPIGGENVISIRDGIGPDTAKTLENGLKEANGKDVIVNINSYGGDVFTGYEMYEMLKDYKGKVTTRTAGIAASAAALVFMGGSKRLIGPRGKVMFHPAATSLNGNVDEFRKAVVKLRQMDESIEALMKERMDLSNVTDLFAWLKEEKFLDREEAMKMKVVNEDEKVEEKEMTAEELKEEEMKSEEEKKEEEMTAEEKEKKKEEEMMAEEKKKQEEMKSEDKEKQKEYAALYRKEREKYDSMILENSMRGGV